MRANYCRLYVHLIWATWDRQPLLTLTVRSRVIAALTAKCDDLRCPALAIGAVADHVHVLAELHPTVAVAELMKGLKGSTSHLLTHAIVPGQPFKWQGSYGAFTVSEKDLAALRQYVKAQEEHHARQSIVAAWEDDPSERQGAGQ